MSFIEAVWGYRAPLIPFAAAYLIFDLGAIIRRYYRWAYLPIYFMFFPLGAADKQYAEYVNEDDFYQVGAHMTDAEKAQLRQRIIATSATSMGFSMILSPMLTGIFCALTMDRDIFLQFLYFLLSIKGMLLIYSAIQLRRVSFVRLSGAFLGVIFIYVVYLLFVWRILLASFDWGRQRILAGGWQALGFDIVDFLIFDIGVYILIAALAGGVVSYWMTKPTILKVVEVGDE